ncbi:hypothetical protein [Sorangium cellulosum]|uniref:HEPN domain-containing protein n=1 Tax=Sorangium cellulosum TaxID=56 RepID=A0A150QHA2_SORCE|nr:hypothetical protein [Sorangium cellulosum]KYF67116.1 hypothetical protein BE15_08535 [Sorangium cellulosum]
MQKPALALHYRHRADSFYRAAQDLEILEAMEHAAAIGLLAVHGCIALADALVMAAEGERPRGDDHGQAARRLRDWCSAKEIDAGGIKHFEWLLGQKSHFSYDERYVDVQDLLKAKMKMDQFFKWAFQSFPEVATIEETDHA